MPRRPRVLIDEGMYHVFNRGNNRRDLFQDEEDFRHFLKLLQSAKAKFRFDLYHYCLMNNHFHLLLQIRKREDLSQLTHRTQLGYARYFKKKYDSVGHVFQERFRSPFISSESYYLQCGRYIERNSVKAGLVREAAEYAYSSAAFYVYGRSDELVTPNPYYLELDSEEGERQKKYREFLRVDEPYGAIVEEALTRV